MKAMMNLKNSLSFALAMFLCFGLMAQQPQLSFFRTYDQTGVNVFEPGKDLDYEFTGLKVRVGGNFAQQFQMLSHENTAVFDTGFYRGDVINLNELYDLASGFNLATANLFIDVQLADGIRLAVQNYMSSRHHPEFWVKGGYIQVDKLPMFGNPDWFAEHVRVKIGHFQINYGDQQFRRSDNGNAMYNPFVSNYIMDAFTTEIGGELYVWPVDELMFMVGMTSGLITGDIAARGGTQERNPSIYLKGAYDKELSDNVRFRLSASAYMNGATPRNTLYGGDRGGSRLYMVMEPAYDVPRGATTPSPTSAGNNFTSGRFNPGFSNEITAIQINPFLKAGGLEVFGTFETSSGKSNFEDARRSVNQIGAEVLYRFLENEQLYVGGRYNSVSGEMARGITDASINRIEVVAGWYPISNLLLKASYVNQTYDGFPDTDLRNGGKFGGAIIEAVVGF